MARSFLLLLTIGMAVLAFAANATASTHRSLESTRFRQIGSTLYGFPKSDEAGRGNVLFGNTVVLATKTGTLVAVGQPTPSAANANGGAIVVYGWNAQTQQWGVVWSLAGAQNEKLDFFAMDEYGTRLAVRRLHGSVEVIDIFSGNQIGSTLFCTQDGDSAVNGETVSLSPDGTRLAITCRSSEGRVELFGLDPLSNDWKRIGQLDGLNDGDLFGFSTSFSSDASRIAVSSPNHDDGDGGLPNTGLVQVFEYEGGLTWMQLGGNMMGDSSSSGQFGFAMAMSGDGNSVVASSPKSSSLGGAEKNVGSVRVFSFDGNDWMQMGLTIYGAAASDRFGRSVAVSYDSRRIAASSWVHDSARGTVLLFEYSNESDSDGQDFHEVASLFGEEKGERLGYGRFLAMTSDGGRLALGSTWASDGTGVSTGSALVVDYLDPLLDPLTLHPSAAPSSAPSKQVDYSVTACQCNENFECATSVVDENAPVWVCVKGVDPGVDVSYILYLYLQQGEAIFNDYSDPLFYPGSRGQSMAIIETKLDEKFFNEDDPENVQVLGTCVVAFGSDDPNEKEANFRVDLEVGIRASSAISKFGHLWMISAISIGVVVSIF